MNRTKLNEFIDLYQIMSLYSILVNNIFSHFSTEMLCNQ